MTTPLASVLGVSEFTQAQLPNKPALNIFKPGLNLAHLTCGEIAYQQGHVNNSELGSKPHGVFAYLQLPVQATS